MTYPTFCVKIFRYADTLGLDYWPGKNHHDHMVRIVKKNATPDLARAPSKTLGIIQLTEDGQHMIAWRAKTKQSITVSSVRQAFDFLILSDNGQQTIH